MLNFVATFLFFGGALFQDPSGYWISSAQSTDDNFYFKSNYISKVGSRITIWTKSVNIVPNDEVEDKTKYTLILRECNCSNYSFKMLSWAEYDQSNELINSHTIKEPDVDFAPPGSVGFRLMNDICKRFNKKKK